MTTPKQQSAKPGAQAQATQPRPSKPIGRYVEICQTAAGWARGQTGTAGTHTDENVCTLAKATYHAEPPRFRGLRYTSLEAAKRGDKGGKGETFDESPQEHLAALKAHAELVYPKGEGPVWVYGLSKNGGRGDVDATHLTTLFLDCDGVGDWHALLDALARARLTFLAQRSGGHTDDNPKWHVAIPIIQRDIPRLPSGLPDKSAYQSAYAWTAGILSHLAGFAAPTEGTHTAHTAYFDLAIAQAFLHVVYPGARRTPEATAPETILHEGGILDLDRLLQLTGFGAHIQATRQAAQADQPGQADQAHPSQESHPIGSTSGDDLGPYLGQPPHPKVPPQGQPDGSQPAPRKFTAAQYAEGQRRAGAYAARLDPSWSGQRGDDALWEAALKVRRGFPLALASEAANKVAATILLKHFNPRCVDRDGKTPYLWDVPTIERKVKEASVGHLGGKADYWLWDEPRDDGRNDGRQMKTPTQPNQPTTATSAKPTKPTLTVIKGEGGKGTGADPNRNGHDDKGDNGDENRDDNRGWIADIVYHKSGEEPKAIFGNASLILANDPRWKGVLAYDEMTSQIEKVSAPPWTPDLMPTTIEELVGKWTDGDINRLQGWFTRHWKLHVSKEVALDAAERFAERNRCNAVKSYLSALVWDGVPRVDDWLTTYLGVVSSPYSRMVGRMWLISAVARIFQPGCMAKYTLVLEGRQDLGKSKATRILGGAWWRDMSLTALKDKDAYIGLRGNWIIELAELDGLNKHEHSRVKHYLSQVKDNYRPPYGRRDIEVARCSVFVGTVNPNSSRGYLNDPTGNVRFWPVLCTRMDDEGLARGKDQIWAEAVSLYSAGVRWWPETPEENAMCRVEQAERSDTDDREPIIAYWLGSEQARELEQERGIFGADVMQYALGLSQSDRMDKRIQTDVGNIMVKLGWVGDTRAGKQFCKNCTTAIGKGKSCAACGGITFYRPKVYRRQNS